MFPKNKLHRQHLSSWLLRILYISSIHITFCTSRADFYLGRKANIWDLNNFDSPRPPPVSSSLFFSSQYSFWLLQISLFYVPRSIPALLKIFNCLYRLFLHPVIFILSLCYILSYDYDSYKCEEHMPLAFFHMPLSDEHSERNKYSLGWNLLLSTLQEAICILSLSHICRSLYLSELFIEPGRQTPRLWLLSNIFPVYLFFSLTILWSLLILECESQSYNY